MLHVSLLLMAMLSLVVDQLTLEQCSRKLLMHIYYECFYGSMKYGMKKKIGVAEGDIA